MFLNENKILGLLCSRLGRYIADESGAYVMKRADGSDVVLLEEGTLQTVRPQLAHIEHLLHDGLVVQDGTTFRLRDGAPENIELDYSM